jgi:hypothetical protein
LPRSGASIEADKSQDGAIAKDPRKNSPSAALARKTGTIGVHKRRRVVNWGQFKSLRVHFEVEL